MQIRPHQPNQHSHRPDEYESSHSKGAPTEVPPSPWDRLGPEVSGFVVPTRLVGPPVDILQLKHQLAGGAPRKAVTKHTRTRHLSFKVDEIDKI